MEEASPKRESRHRTNQSPVGELNVSKTKSPEVITDRRKAEKAERRVANIPVASDRRKVQRRRQIDPTTCERDYSPEEIEFMEALDEYKRASGRMFPTCSEILEVVKAMGYTKTNMAMTTLPTDERATICDIPAAIEA